METVCETSADAVGLVEEAGRDLAEGDPGRGLAGRRPLEHRAGVLVAVLLHADEVGVAGPRTGQRLVARDLLLGVDVVGRGIRLVADGLGAHHRRPLRPLAVADAHRDRATPGSARGGHRRGTRPRPARTSSARRGHSPGAGGTGRPRRSSRRPRPPPGGPRSWRRVRARATHRPSTNATCPDPPTRSAPPPTRPLRGTAGLGRDRRLAQSSGRTCTTREMSRPSSIHGPKAMSSLREPRRRTRRTSP